jgi:hypothetical protein
MKTPYTPNFLRRTAVAFAAVAVSTISLSVSAQTNALRKSTGETVCTYSTLTVAPNGGITVTCDATVIPGAPGVFSLSGPSANLPQTGQGTMTIARSNGSTGAATVNYTISGGCGPLSGAVAFADGALTGTYVIRTPGYDTICSSSLTSATVGSVGSPSTVNVGVGAAVVSPPTPPTPPTPPVQPGCPTPPSDVLDFELKLSGADRLIMASGRIAAAILPAVRAAGGVSPSGKIVFGESTISPRAATVEFSVTKCRGVIDTNAGFCYLRSSNPTFMRRDWIEEPIWGATTDATANAYELCKAYLTGGPWYVNVRYTYSPGDCSYGNCGFVDQWNFSGW